MERRGRATSLAPGFRFHPTDVELISYYLKRKICGKPFRFDAISEIDIYKAEPWDLPGFSKLKTRDLEWYFFSSLDKKYGNGSKTNRATTEGYWKTTGKDRSVYHKSRVAGMKKTLVYHRGRAPRGERTNWVMHEYRLVDEELEKAAVTQESFVLCRIFQKSGSGPKNGEHYGAPFIEEEWEDDEVAVTPAESATDDMCASDDAFFNINDVDQNLEVEPLENSSFSLGLDNENDNTLAMNPIAFTEDANFLTMVNEETQVGEGMNDVRRFFSLPVEHDRKTVKIEYIAEPNNLVSHDPASYLPGEQGEENANCGADEGFFFEANDLLAPTEAKSSEFELHERYLSCFSSDDNIDQYLSLDTPDLLVGDVSLPDEPFFPKENLAESTSQASTSRQLADTQGSDCASSSKQVMLAPKSETDFDYPFIKQGSYMLGCFPASLGYASEFPTKDMAAHLNAASAHSSEPVRVTAGFMRIQNHFSANDNGIRACVDKTGKVNMAVFFDISYAISGGSIPETLSGKLASAISLGWFFSIFWVVVFVISAKVGSCIYAMS